MRFSPLNEQESRTFKPPQYERVMLPPVVLRCFDCVLKRIKDAVLTNYAQYQGKLEGDALDSVLNKISGQRFHNHSPLGFDKLKGDPGNAHLHLVFYISGFSENVRKIFEHFEFGSEIERMREHDNLFLVIKRFCDADLKRAEEGIVRLLRKVTAEARA